MSNNGVPFVFSLQDHLPGQSPIPRSLPQPETPKMPILHLHDELAKNPARITVETTHGKITGGRAINGAAVFLEIPYGLPPVRFEDPKPLPTDFRYEEKEYVGETIYAAQPTNDGQAQDTPFEEKVGLGKPSENPLFLNIVAPPAFPSITRLPVKIYIHGGFLQFGSPHSLGSQAQYIAADRSEIWVNIGYRLSAFGFLACDEPKLTGNYGFKDQWIALEWVKSHIEAFGGNPNDIQVTGLSAGAHSVHQLLHHAAQLPEGQLAPFQSASMQSNALVTDPKTPQELRPQFQALCKALGLNPSTPDILSTLQDPEKVPWTSIVDAIENSLGTQGTYRGCLSNDWFGHSALSPMAFQRSGELARGLKAHGVKSIIIGDLTEEWYLYSIANPINSPKDILPNLERCFPRDVAEQLLQKHKALPDEASSEDCQRLFGDVLSCGQVHLPIRLFVRDMQDFPVVRYEIRWTPEQKRTMGYVTHGTDRCIWAFREPSLEGDQKLVARNWLDRIETEVRSVEERGKPVFALNEMLTLKEDRVVEWTKDAKWDELMKLSNILPGEESI